MKLTWHIIKKDLLQYRWSLAFWLACFAYIFLFQERIDFQGNPELKSYFRLTSLMTILVFSGAMLISIVQQDPPMGASVFWRTRPISPGRMLVAKLCLLGALFVGVPLLIMLLGGWLQKLVLLHTLREYALMILVLGSITLSLAAAAACTKNIAYATLLWVGAVFGGGTLADLLGRFLPELPVQLSMQLNMNRVITLLVISVVFSLATILNQYLHRRLSVTIALLVIGNVAVVLVGTLWGYYYFYTSQ